MSFSRMNFTTLLSRVLRTTVSKAIVAMVVGSLGLTSLSYADRSSSDFDRGYSRRSSSDFDRSGRYGRSGSGSVCEADLPAANKRSYAERLSELKEEIANNEYEMAELKDRIRDDQEKLRKISGPGWESLDDDDRMLQIYGGDNCNCGPDAGCSADMLLSIGAVKEEDTTVMTAADCRDVSARKNPNAGATNLKDLGSRATRECAPIRGLNNNLNQAAVCSNVYEYNLSVRRDAYSSTARVPTVCLAKARKCGAVARDIEIRRLPGQINDLKDKLADLNNLYKKCVKKRRTIDDNCSECSVLAEQGLQGNRPTALDWVQAGAPLLAKGMDMAMFYKAQNTGLKSIQAQVNGNIANCDAYISQGTTLGIPSNQCMNSIYSSGIYSGGIGGIGYGIGGGYPGGIGYGMSGGYAMGGYPGGIGSVIGSAIGGGYAMGGYPGGIGGGIGYGMGGGYAMGGYPGGNGGGIGYGIGGGYAMGGYPGGIGGGIGYGMGGGYAMGGYPGGIGGGIGYGMGGGYAMGGYPGGIGGNIGYGGGMGGGYISSYIGGMDPTMQLNQQHAQMQQQNMQLSQQQVMESQMRYQQIAGQMSGGYGQQYGQQYGGYQYGYPGYGNYGAVGNLIGTLGSGVMY